MSVAVHNLAGSVRSERSPAAHREQRYSKGVKACVRFQASLQRMLVLTGCRQSSESAKFSSPRWRKKDALMVLTVNSLVAAARHKTLRAKRHIELAQADLHEANKQLEQAIPL